MKRIKTSEACVILNRRSIRLAEYDYRWAGYYFITCCVSRREKLFGKIEAGTASRAPTGKSEGAPNNNFIQNRQYWQPHPNAFQANAHGQ